jgi:hypothetical protein
VPRRAQLPCFGEHCHLQRRATLLRQILLLERELGEVAGKRVYKNLTLADDREERSPPREDERRLLEKPGVARLTRIDGIPRDWVSVSVEVQHHGQHANFDGNRDDRTFDPRRRRSRDHGR